jgi:hypothetical protein
LKRILEGNLSADARTPHYISTEDLDQINDTPKLTQVTKDANFRRRLLPRRKQQIEAGCRITVTTLLRICDELNIRVDRIVHDLDHGIYRS